VTSSTAIGTPRSRQTAACIVRELIGAGTVSQQRVYDPPFRAAERSDMRVDEYAELDAIALRDLIRAREVGEDEVLAVAREAIEAVDGTLNALAMPLFDEPLAYSPGGPFAGVPFLIKNSGPVAEGVPFDVGSDLFAGAVAPCDLEIMQRFRAAGLAALGVTNVPEMVISFATESRRHGITRNPWNPEKGTGGSSGGAAALVAAGAVPVAHGNDGAGSIRIPSSACGLVGLKPSRGRTPAGPYESELLFGLAYEFALARTVRDVAHLLDAVHGAAVGDKVMALPPAVPFAEALRTRPTGLRVALATSAWSGVPVDPECAAAARAVADELLGAGHEVVEASPAIDADLVREVYIVLTLVGLGGLLAAPPVPAGPHNLEPVALAAIEGARGTDAVRVAGAFRALHAVTRAAALFFEAHDVLVTPTLAHPPWPHGALSYERSDPSMAAWVDAIFEYGPFTASFNIGGQPAISVPTGLSADGLPIGVQLVAAHGREDLLLALAAHLEEALPWSGRRPRVHAGAGAELSG
jgi:amidase